MPDYHGKANPNFGNHKLSEVYKNDKFLSKKKQGRPGLKNGRCRKIKLFKDGQFINEFDYISLCCKYLIEVLNMKSSIDTVRGRIDESCRKNRPYKGYTFEKVN